MVQKDFFLPGSEWVYYKFYVGEGYSNRFIEQYLYPIIVLSVNKKVICQWFFIRYNDPDHHLRVRFKLLNKNNLGDFLLENAEKFNPLIESGVLSSLELSTYKREWNRYGKVNMDMVEKLWFYESEYLIKNLLILGDTNEYVIFVIVTIHMFLKEYYDNWEVMLTVTERNYLAFSAEFKIKKEERKILSNKYRNLSSNNTLDIDKFEEIYSGYEMSSDYKEKIKSALSNLENKTDSLCSSLVHMLVNRAFNKSQRHMELTIYHHLYNIYKSKFARNKRGL